LTTLYKSLRVSSFHSVRFFLLYEVTDPDALIWGQEKMAYEAGRWTVNSGYVPAAVTTIQRWKANYGMPTSRQQAPSGRWADTIVAQSLWAQQSMSWIREVEASQKNGALPVRAGSRPRGRPRSEQSSGSSAQRTIGTTLVDVSPLIT
jgi:hypothetical protein